MPGIPRRPVAAVGTAVPEDRYKALYEGSQRSLADMAANHALLLNRIRKVRSNLVRMLKEADPLEFSALESNYQGRIEDMDDEMFLACMQHLVTTMSTRLPPRPAMGRVPQAPSAPSEGLGPADPEPDGDYSMADGRPDFSRLLADLNRSADKSRSAAAAPAAPSPSAHGTAPADDSRQPEPDAADGPERTGPAGPEEREAEAMTSLASVLAEYLPDDGSRDDDGLETMTEDWPDDDGFEDFGEFPDIEEPDAPVAHQEAEEPPGPASHETVVVPTRRDRASEAVKSAPAVAPMSSAHAKPASRSRRASRRPSVDAVPPHETDPAMCDGPQADAFMAMAASPRPMFASSMAASAAGGMAAVDAWRISQYESESRDVRFLSPKKKWSSYGHLVLPSQELLSAAGCGDGWWAQTLSRVTGSRLYELAVLMDSVCSDMTDWDMSESGQAMSAVAVTPRGRVGIVAVMPPPEKEVWREELSERLGLMASRRLELIAVLCTSKAKEDAVAAAAAQACASSGWELPCPVVAAGTADWDRGLDAAVPVAMPRSL